MSDQPTKTLTAKGERTRKRILDTALELFAAKGYEATTMRDIAEKADCSLGLAYRYFSSKEDLVLAMYARFSEQTAVQIANLAQEPLAARFHQAMLDKFEQLSPYRSTLGALFGAAMNPDSSVAVLGEGAAGVRDNTLRAFITLVSDSSDAPKQAQSEQIATILFGMHLALILFWLYDPTPDQRATYELLNFTRDVIGRTRRLLLLPPIAKSLARLAEIAEVVFVGRMSNGGITDER